MKSDKRNWLVWLWLAAAIGCTLFIWSNSMKTAGESHGQSSAVLQLLEPLLSAVGIAPLRQHFVLRKLAHMTEFAALGFSWVMFFSGKSRKMGRAAVWAMAVSLLTAAGDETLQLFTPGRSGQLSDVIIDLCGALIAVAAVSLVRFCTARSHKKAKKPEWQPPWYLRENPDAAHRIRT